jgi:hypothetical protein
LLNIKKIGGPKPPDLQCSEPNYFRLRPYFFFAAFLRRFLAGAFFAAFFVAFLAVFFFAALRFFAGAFLAAFLRFFAAMIFLLE